MNADASKADEQLRRTLAEFASVKLRNVEPRVRLYKLYHDEWWSTERLSQSVQRGGAPLLALEPLTRAAFLLSEIANFNSLNISNITGLKPTEVREHVRRAEVTLASHLTGDAVFVGTNPSIFENLHNSLLSNKLLPVQMSEVAAFETEAVDRPKTKVVITTPEVWSQLRASKDAGAGPIFVVVTDISIGEQPPDELKSADLLIRPHAGPTLIVGTIRKLLVNRLLRDQEAALLALSNTDAKSGGPPPQSAVAPLAAPVDAEVRGGILRLKGTLTPSPGTPLERFVPLLRDAAANAERLASQFEGSNAGPGLVARLNAISQTLAAEPSEGSSLLLGSQVRALEVMLPEIREVVTGVNAADLTAFVRGLKQLVRQFPSWRAFIAEARGVQPLSGADKKAIQDASAVLEAQPDDAVDPALKDALAANRAAQQSVRDPLLDLGQVRSVANAFRALARPFSSTGAEAKKQLVGILSKKALAAVISGASTALTYLAAAFPQEFGWVPRFLNWWKSLQ